MYTDVAIYESKQLWEQVHIELYTRIYIYIYVEYNIRVAAIFVVVDFELSIIMIRGEYVLTCRFSYAIHKFRKRAKNGWVCYR